MGRSLKIVLPFVGGAIAGWIFIKCLLSRRKRPMTEAFDYAERINVECHEFLAASTRMIDG